VIIALALFLALPALSFAGSANSRWDLTIGGFVKVDWGWADNQLGLDASTAIRKGNPGSERDAAGNVSMRNPRENRAYEYGTMGVAVGQSQLNFLVKGPDAWGAKTSAFVEFEFRGQGYGISSPASNVSNYDTAIIRHAFMKFDWANDSILIGKYWANWNAIPLPLMPANYYGFGEAKNNRIPQVKWEHRFGKSLATSLAFLAPSNDALGGFFGYDTNSVNNAYARSMAPFLSGAIDFKSDACGKIGMNSLQFGTSALIGYSKETWWDVNNTASYGDKNVKSWGVSTYGMIPIIPERNNNKTFAWLFSAGASAYSNIQAITGPIAFNNAYARGQGQIEVAPTYYSWWSNTNFWLSDKVSLNAYYASTRLGSSSQNYKTGGVFDANNPTTYWNGNGVPIVNDQYTLNVAYDVNPAIRFIAEAGRLYSIYGRDINQVTATTDSAGDRGISNYFRLAAFYYF
jgi:hypothetical protein